MNLPDRLVSKFAKVTNDRSGKSERTLYGTIVKKDGSVYVKLDGSDILTPAYTTVETADGERVMVMIKNHTAIINGNITSPAARNDDVQKIQGRYDEASKTATDFIRKADNAVTIADHESEEDTDMIARAKSLRFYIKSAAEVYKPYYEFGDSINVEWTGSGFVSDSSTKVYFSIPLAKPVLGNTTPVVTSSNGLKIRQNGAFTHGSSADSYVLPTYSATLSCDGGIVNVIATLSSTANAVNEAVCGVAASLKIAFS